MSSDEFDLRGRRALITGSSRGIGRAIALALARHGADIAVHYASREQQAIEVAEEAKKFGVKAITVGGDLADASAPRSIHDQVVAQLGGIDILILNASVQYRQPWNNITLEQFHHQVNVNFLSTLLFMQLAIPPMQQRGWGRVVAVGSVQEVKPHKQMAVYAATKQAQRSLVRNIAAQVSGSGVTVNNLSPGVFATDRNAEPLSDPAIRERVIAGIPTGFIAGPEDAAGAALLLCSDAGRYITGADIRVDGGMSL